MDEAALIAEFQNDRSENAFAALVRRHVDFVYATALRKIGDRGLAEEVTQNVFLALARKADALRGYKTVAGWLYQATLNEARQRVRSELRRQHREQAAADTRTRELEGESVWKPLIPLLDEGLQAMAEPDRMAVLLHCLEGRPFREVGAALGVGEDAARKRVDRAIEALGGFFKERGYAVPTLTATAPLFLLASTPAPAALASLALSAAATTGAFTAAGAGAAHAFPTVMISTQLKAAIAGALAIAGLATAVILQHRELTRTRKEHSALRERLEALSARDRRTDAASLDESERQRLLAERSELLRLRSEVNALRRRNLELVERQPDPSRETPPDDTPVPGPGPAITTLRADVRASVGKDQTLVLGGWQTDTGRHMMMFLTPQAHFGGDAQSILVESLFIDASEEMIAAIGLQDIMTDSSESSANRILSAADLKEILAAFKDTEGIKVLGGPRVVTLGGNEAQLSVTQATNLAGTIHHLGPALKITPTLSSEGASVELKIEAAINTLTPGPR